VIIDQIDPTLIVIQFDSSQGKDPLYLNSAARETVLEELQVKIFKINKK